MERSNIIKRIKSKTTTIDMFNYDTLSAPPLLALLSYEDIEYFRRLATSIKYSAKIDFKYSEIDRIMKMRGFVKLGGGTNRVVYRHLEIDTIVVKIAIDNIGIKDNPREYENQFYLKPYVTKVFEVSPCGTVGLFERCDQITSREEFQSVAAEVFDLLSNWIIGKYIMEDIGTKYFMNYCIRPGFGPVLCDFPYLYELDGNKLYCRIPNENGILCDGIIDYDKGFNHLYCSKCGAKYKAIELKKAIENKLIISKEKENIKMKLKLKLGDKTLKVCDNTNQTKKYESKRERTYRRIKENNPVDCIRITTSKRKKEETVTTVLGEIVNAVEYTVENKKDDFEKLSNYDNEINTIESEEDYKSVNGSNQEVSESLFEHFEGDTFATIVVENKDIDIDVDDAYEYEIQDEHSKEESIEIVEEDNISEPSVVTEFEGDVEIIYNKNENGGNIGMVDSEDNHFVKPDMIVDQEIKNNTETDDVYDDILAKAVAEVQEEIINKESDISIEDIEIDARERLLNDNIRNSIDEYCNELFCNIKNLFVDAEEKVLLDLTISLRTADGVNILTDDFEDIEDELEEEIDSIDEEESDDEVEYEESSNEEEKSDDEVEEEIIDDSESDSDENEIEEEESSEEDESIDDSYDDGEDDNINNNRSNSSYNYNYNTNSGFIPQEDVIKSDIPVGAIPPKYNNYNKNNKGKKNKKKKRRR